jgi:mono/diheme cytochrome c family protein
VHRYRPVLVAAAAVLLSALSPHVAAADAAPAAKPAAARKAAPDRASIERGRYLIRTSGCNDCHTPGYAQQNGQVDEKLWLTGDALGWSGPWGTTYPTNLRLWMQKQSEAEWLDIAHTFQPRPPMPWFNVHAMSEADLRAIYRYVTWLGPAGQPAPAYVPPGGQPKGPVVRFPG